jgi:trehalose 6-phosphate phosphatase
VHYRNVVPLPREDLDEALAALVAEAHARGLHTLAGRAVIEVRPPIANKATGLSRVRDRVAPDAAVVYAGDDATDEPALAFAARRGLAVYVASAERAHPRGIDGLLVTVQPAWCAALGALARDAE